MADKEAARLLKAAIDTLEAAVVPSLTRDDTKIALDLVIRILLRLQTRFSVQEQGIEHLLGKAQGILDELSVSKPAGAAKVTVESPLDLLESKRNKVEAALGEHIPSLVAAAGKGDADALTTLTHILDSQRDYLALVDPDTLKGIAVVYQGGRIYREQKEAPKALIDEASVSAALRHQFPDAEVTASKVKVLAGGFSKVTALFTKDTKGAASESLVMRRDLPQPFMNRPVVNEFPLLQKVYREGVRVAEPCWIEADARYVGGAFMVSRQVSGSSNPGEWQAHPGAAKSVAADLAELLAKLHGLDLAQLGYGADVTGKSAGQGVADEVAWWAARYAEWRQRSNPLLDIPLAWLQQNVPQHLFEMPARVVHGDVGFHNLMVDQGKVTALLDWEFWHFGDPNEDLAFARMFMNQVGAWDEFIARYRACGGIEFSAECERYFNVWTSVRNAIGCIDAGLRFNGAPMDKVELKYAVSGVLAPYIELDSTALVMKYLGKKKVD